FEVREQVVVRPRAAAFIMQAMKIPQRLLLAVAVAVLAGCASQRPVLYPNAKYKQVGDAAARRDVDDCIRLAEQAGAAHGGGERAVRRGAEGAAVGGVTGAVAGAVGRRNVLDSAAAGAAVGGA